MFGRSFANKPAVSQAQTEKQIYSVSQLNKSVKVLIEQHCQDIWLTGEISNFAAPVSGHWYLTLKDENAQVRCAMFRMQNSRVNFRPQNGMQVLVRAKASLYEARGDYQLIIDSMQSAGDGLLQQQFDALKKRLQDEGLFDASRKQTLPYCQTIGLITSKSGAALQDMLRILQRRAPNIEVIIYPSQVQGKAATAEIVRMIELANQRNECDLLIVGRGGGSLEDLWCFNEEAVARAIAGSQLPIISAVGHETDFTIADFVADLRAATPSMAAEIVSQETAVQLDKLHTYQERLEVAFDYLFNRKSQQWQYLQQRLNHQHPQRYMQQQMRYIESLNQRLMQLVQQQLAHKQITQYNLQQRLQQQHPGRNVQRQSEELTRYKNQLTRIMQNRIMHHHERLQGVHRHLNQHKPQVLIQQKRQQLTQQQQLLQLFMHNQLQHNQQQLAKMSVKLDGLSPLTILARGYSITTTASGRAVTDSDTLNIGDRLTTRLSKGFIVSEVVEK